MIPLFTPVLILRAAAHGRAGELRARTIEPHPKYDAVLDDGTTVIANLVAGEFAITGAPRSPAHVIPFEGSAA